jgi:hypothetical protein
MTKEHIRLELTKDIEKTLLYDYNYAKENAIDFSMRDEYWKIKRDYALNNQDYNVLIIAEIENKNEFSYPDLKKITYGTGTKESRQYSELQKNLIVDIFTNGWNNFVNLIK